MPDSMKLDALVTRIGEAFTSGAQRPFVVGIAGPPASGKSTLSESVAEALRRHVAPTVVALPMDGFHLPNAEIARRGIAAFKGREDTFDAAGFAALLRRVRAGEGSVGWPTFSRSLDAAVPDGIVVPDYTELVVVEGNYLLLDTGDWAAVRDLLDIAVQIDAPEAVLVARLIERHVAGGRTDAEAMAKIEGTDLPNMRLVRSMVARADIVIDAGTR